MVGTWEHVAWCIPQSLTDVQHMTRCSTFRSIELDSAVFYVPANTV